MIVSDNELVMTVLKACVGCGVPRGVAEDLAQACLALANAGKPPLQALIPALETFAPNTATPVWQQNGARWETETLNAVPHGPSMVDFARLAEGVVAQQVDYPDLVWGLAKATGLAFQFEGKAEAISLSISPSKAATTNVTPHTVCNVDDAEWEQLCTHATLILVPANATNQADAGAGLTDND